MRHPESLESGTSAPVPRRGRRLRAASALVVAGGLALGACGTVSKLTTGRSISDSISAIGNQSSVSLRFSLGIDQNQAMQLSRRDGGTPMSPAEARALTTGSIFFSEQTGHGEALNSKQAATDHANSVDIGLQIGNDVPVEIRYVEQALYARVDVNQLLSDTGQDTRNAASFSSDLQQANRYVPGLGALGQGKWVEVTQSGLKSLSGLLNQYASSLGGSNSQPNRDQVRNMATSLRKDLTKSLQDNATYKNLGTQDGQTEYGVTVDVHGFLNQFGPALQNDLNSIPGGLGTKASNALKQAETKIPAKQTVVVNLFVQSNKLTQVQLDANQFAGKDKMAFPVPVKLDISTPPAITAPSGATPLDLSKLPQLISGLFSGLSSTRA